MQREEGLSGKKIYRTAKFLFLPSQNLAPLIFPKWLCPFLFCSLGSFRPLSCFFSAIFVYYIGVYWQTNVPMLSDGLNCDLTWPPQICVLYKMVVFVVRMHHCCLLVLIDLRKCLIQLVRYRLLLVLSRVKYSNYFSQSQLTQRTKVSNQRSDICFLSEAQDIVSRELRLVFVLPIM